MKCINTRNPSPGRSAAPSVKTLTSSWWGKCATWKPSPEAETGHLVLGTLHTRSAARTVDRVLDVFPVEQRDQIRIMVSESLRGIISQQLVPRADGNGRALAIEMLVNTPAIANCIREGKTFMIPGCIQTGKAQGMILMDDSLRALHQAGLITTEDCIFRAEDKTIMESFLGIK